MMKPKEREYVHVLVPTNILEAFNEAAKELGMTKSECLRYGIRLVIDEAKKKKK